MKPIKFLASALAASVLVFTYAGCVGPGTDASSAIGTPIAEGTAAADQEGLRLRFRRRPPPPPMAGMGSGAAGGPSSSSCAAPTGNIDAIIKAAQTPDGRAIPQASLPGGCCPKVVAALGFWSCATLGDACHYSASGATHHCTCNRVDGEGQLPAWVCD
ncbi:MAG TPA: hypothetical protein VJV78_33660 [Polyangiales bacterium]|nr:hypothetical protein [Polyangiales bacterium]